MRTYNKIDTVFQRDTAGTKKLIPGVFRDPTIEYLALNKWIWTEKVDETNIRVYWDGHRVSFDGRTDNANIPAPLMNKLNELFGGSTNEELFEQAYGDKEVILFGEGYGRKIQKNGTAYLPNDVGFILFDVLIGDNYQEREWVEKTAEMFGIPVVPIIGTGSLYEATAYVIHKPDSVVAEGRREMEGLVCRPEQELRDRRGERIIVKIKWDDMKEFSANDITI